MTGAEYSSILTHLVINPFPAALRLEMLYLKLPREMLSPLMMLHFCWRGASKRSCTKLEVRRHFWMSACLMWKSLCRSADSRWTERPRPPPLLVLALRFCLVSRYFSITSVVERNVTKNAVRHCLPNSTSASERNSFPYLCTSERDSAT